MGVVHGVAQVTREEACHVRVGYSDSILSYQPSRPPCRAWSARGTPIIQALSFCPRMVRLLVSQQPPHQCCPADCPCTTAPAPANTHRVLTECPACLEAMTCMISSLQHPIRAPGGRSPGASTH